MAANPGSVFGEDSIATATSPFRTATLLTTALSAMSPTVRVSTSVGADGSLISSTFSDPSRAFTTNALRLAASYPVISAALSPNTPELYRPTNSSVRPVTAGGTSTGGGLSLLDDRQPLINTAETLIDRKSVV